jgi:uncharacterized protein (DUF2141 family)
MDKIVKMLKILKLLLFFLPVAGLAQNELIVQVQGVRSSLGNINVAVYNKADGFLKFEGVYISDSTQAIAGRTQIRITNLPSGEYALAVFHDQNGNNVLDTNWLGIPKEPVGFSNARMKTFGPPSFKECSFRLSSNQAVQVSL